MRRFTRPTPSVGRCTMSGGSAAFASDGSGTQALPGNIVGPGRRDLRPPVLASQNIQYFTMPSAPTAHHCKRHPPAQSRTECRGSNVAFTARLETGAAQVGANRQFDASQRLEANELKAIGSQIIETGQRAAPDEVMFALEYMAPAHIIWRR